MKVCVLGGFTCNFTPRGKFLVAASQTTVNTLGTQRGRLPAVPVNITSSVDAGRFLESTVVERIGKIQDNKN